MGRRELCPGLTVHASLPGSSSEKLIVSTRAARRERWVLRWLPEDAIGHGADRTDGTLRGDIGEIAALRHPALALTRSIGRDWANARSFLLRSHVEGADSASALTGKSVPELLPYLTAAAESLALLHRFGLLHLNVKASNFIVPRAALYGRRKSGPRIVLVDEGWREHDASANGEPPTFSTDLQALGWVFYGLLTERGEDVSRLSFPSPPSHAREEVPVDLDRVVLKLLNPEPTRSYQRAEELLSDLHGITSPPTRARTVSMAPECFLGREEELELARDALSDRARPGAIAILGEAGTGKTALLERIGIEAQRRGYRTVSWRCFPGDASSRGPLEALARTIAEAHPQRRKLLREHRALFAEAREVRPHMRSRYLRDVLDFLTRACEDAPTLIAIDDAHLADSLTRDFLVEFLTSLEEARTGGTEPGTLTRQSLAISLRSESPFRNALADLIAALLRPPHVVLELKGLPDDVVEHWLELALRGSDRELPGAAEISALGGNPLAVSKMIRSESGRRGEVSAHQEHVGRLFQSYFDSLVPAEKQLLTALAVLGRPAAPAVVGEICELPEARVRRAVTSLIANGTLGEDRSRLEFRHGSFQDWLDSILERPDCRALHGRVARVLKRRGVGTLEDIAFHWMNSEDPGRGIAVAVRAARRLERSYQDRPARALYERVLELLPNGRKRIRRRIVTALAEILARSGEEESAAKLLEDLLADGTDDAGHLHGRAGCFRQLAGDLGRAREHLERGLALLDEPQCSRDVRDRIGIMAELAELDGNRGEYGRAETLCHEALAEVAKIRSAESGPDLCREEISFLEILGSLELRRFRYDEARANYQRAVKLGGRLGEVPELSLIYNNLGVLENQNDRYPEAIRAYESARRLAARFGQQPMLVSIDCNLGILLAKTGQPEAAEEALRRAARADARCESTRTRFLRLHGAGIVGLLIGEFGAAISSLREAISLGEELGDRHMVAFDWTYLAECAIQTGDPRTAALALERALSAREHTPRPVQSMVCARRAFLAGLCDDADTVRAEQERYAELGTATVPYVEAWDRFWLGSAARLIGERDAAREELTRSHRFFSRVEVPVGELFAGLELSALDMDTGRTMAARRRLHEIRAKHRCGRGAMRNPVVSVRFLVTDCALRLVEENVDTEAALALLVDAESRLMGLRRPQIESEIRELRERSRQLASASRAGESSSSGENGELPLQDEVLRLVEETSASIADQVRRAAKRAPVHSLAEIRRCLVENLDRVRKLERRAPTTPDGAQPLDTRAIVGRSPVTRALVDSIGLLAPSDLPVLILGETGVGKELVARALHGDSPRADAPFCSVNCAALPEALLESELFGYAQGAFSGADRSRAGILASAEGGTFLFDEVGDLPLALQGKVLRVIDARRARPLGQSEEVALNVRFVFATNQDLEDRVAHGAFREDLYFRVRTAELRVPPLRERTEDLPDLIEHFRRGRDAAGREPVLEDSALRALEVYSWPGNVRELRNLLDRLRLIGPDRITEREITLALGGRAETSVFSPALLRNRELRDLQSQLDREYLELALTDCNGDVAALAARLGVSARAVYKKLRRLGIVPGTRRRDP